jgi:hypothetical protein
LGNGGFLLHGRRKFDGSVKKIIGFMGENEDFKVDLGLLGLTEVKENR